MAIFVIDANIPISLDRSGIKLLDEFLRMFKETGDSLHMCRSNFLEIATGGIRSKLRECKELTIDVLDPKVYRDVRAQVDSSFGRRGAGIQRPDHECIAFAVQVGAHYVVSNDRKLLAVLEAFRKSQNVPPDALLPTHSANLLRLMYMLKRFDLKRYILMNANYYHHFEIEALYNGIKHGSWSPEDAFQSFVPYVLNIREALGGS